MRATSSLVARERKFRREHKFLSNEIPRGRAQQLPGNLKEIRPDGNFRPNKRIMTRENSVLVLLVISPRVYLHSRPKKNSPEQRPTPIALLRSVPLAAFTPASSSTLLSSSHPNRRRETHLEGGRVAPRIDMRIGM